MSQLSEPEIVASLYALGIGSDARGTSVMIVGHPDGYLSGIVLTRLESFGAKVYWAHESVTDPDIVVDYLVTLPAENAIWNVAKLAGNVLKPGGRYLVLLDELGNESDLVTITDAQALGVSAARVLGYKARRDVGGIDQ